MTFTRNLLWFMLTEIAETRTYRWAEWPRVLCLKYRFSPACQLNRTYDCQEFHHCRHRHPQRLSDRPGRSQHHLRKQILSFLQKLLGNLRSSHPRSRQWRCLRGGRPPAGWATCSCSLVLPRLMEGRPVLTPGWKWTMKSTADRLLLLGRADS